MNAHVPKHPVSSPRRNALGFAVLAAIALVSAGTMSQPALAETLEEASISTPAALKQAAQELRADYRQQQWQRLAQKTDRDSLIAAVMIGMADGDDRAAIDGNAQVAERLAQHFGGDPLALFTLALSCQMKTATCTQPQAYDALVRIAPNNSAHWLLLPNGAAPNDAQLHAAAAAPFADSHLRDIFQIVRAALADQPAPALRAGVDPRELALILRRDAVDQVPLQHFAAVVTMCKTAVGARSEDCIRLGRRLQADRSGAIISRMIGSVVLRRLEKGSPEGARAKELRRDYVYMGEQLVASKVPYEERLQNETAVFGEWEASQRAVERLGEPRTPPAGWMPKNPQTLLMSEERTPAPAK
jgi:hypothetical protein